jgi:hypothetical protein
MKTLCWIALILALSLAGCAGNEIVTGTGEAALDAYIKQGKTVGQAVPLARRTAFLVAQRDLVERYAGTFLDSETQIKNFVAQSDRIISRSQGLVKGARIVRAELSPDQSMYMVEVEANLADLEKSLGEKPDFTTQPLVWPTEIGGVPGSEGESPKLNVKTTTVTATGVGIKPAGLDPRVALLRAKRAARTDALRKLAEKVKGIQLTASTTVEDFMAKEDRIRTSISTLIRGAEEVSSTEKPDGTVEMTVAVKVTSVQKALGLE